MDYSSCTYTVPEAVSPASLDHLIIQKQQWMVPMVSIIIMVVVVVAVVAVVMLLAPCRLDKEANTPMLVEQVVFAGIASDLENWVVVAFRVT